MHGLRHAFTGALYERIEDKLVQITHKDGRVGVFTSQGRWVSGDKFDGDPQLCLWVAADRGVHRMVNTASH